MPFEQARAGAVGGNHNELVDAADENRAVTTLADTSADWLARDASALSGVLKRATDIVAASAEGSWIIDADGRRYLDFTSGIAVANVGHSHPRVVAAAIRQLATLIHVSVVAHHTPAIRLAERIAASSPFLDDPQVFFCNSGAEAVDGALKLARRVTSRPGIVAFDGAFHGRTMAATSLTSSKRAYRCGYEPLLEPVYTAPYDSDPGVLDEILAGGNVGAVVVEPVLGEGGYIVPSVAWLRAVRTACDRHAALLIFDEVQTGVGRTGRMWASQTFGVAPDIFLFAKAIASGLPLGGIVAPRSVMDGWPRGAHGSTFGGNPVACAAALATLDVIEEQELPARARMLGNEILRALPGSRGVGLMVGLDLGARERCAAVRAHCLHEGLLVIPCGPDDEVVRICPPLTIGESELREGLDILTTAVRYSS